MTNTTTSQPSTVNDPAQQALVLRTIKKKSFAVLSTVSNQGFPHAAGVVYDTINAADHGPIVLYTHTMRSSRKARNIEAHGRAGVVIPVRKLPVGPPFTVQFQARAALLAMDDPEITAHLTAGRLKKISGHGELDESDGCFIRIEPRGLIHSYGLGVSILALARDPLHAGARSVAMG